MKRQEATWFACYTNPQKEGLVHMLLGLQGFETLYLHYPWTIRHARKERHILRSYFPRYIFVAVGQGQAVGNINNTTGVSTVVMQGDDPLEIPLPVIEELPSPRRAPSHQPLSQQAPADFRTGREG